MTAIANLLAGAALALTPAPTRPAQADTPYMQYVDSADRCLSRSQWTEAERLLTLALRAEPANAGNMLLLSNLGTARTQRGDWRGAVEAYDIALARAPRSTALLTNRALAHLGASDTESALRDLDTALDVDSTLTRALETRGMVRLNTGDVPGAQADFERLSRLDPESTAALAGLAQCHAAEGLYAEAAVLMRRAVEGDGDEAYHFLLGVYLLQSGNTLELADVLRPALEQHPRSGRLHLLRAALHRRNHLLSESDAALSLARKHGVDPGLVDQLLPRQH